MPKQRAEFRENPKRAIYLTGEISQATVDQLTPRINELRLESSEPITVYIDSPGGSIFHARAILALLRTANADGEFCRVITVATTRVASAAADLLAGGDYVIAYPHAVLVFHGTRQQMGKAVTKEFAAILAESLKETNERFALALADTAFKRFFFRYTIFRLQFEEIRKGAGNPHMSDLECLARSLSSKLPAFPELPERALQRHYRLNALTTYYSKKIMGRRLNTQAQFESLVLKSIIDFELRSNRKDLNWTFSSGGLSQVEEDFLLLVDYNTGDHTQNLDSLVDDYGVLCINGQKQAELKSIEDEARKQAFIREEARPVVRPLWYFFVSVCRLLQERDHHFSAEEAYWLGLIDEVVGRPELISIRQMIENYGDLLQPAVGVTEPAPLGSPDTTSRELAEPAGATAPAAREKNMVSNVKVGLLSPRTQ